MLALGIDLGTSNSAIARYHRGQVDSFSVDGKRVVPSCVAANPNGGLLVGRQAKQRASITPDQAVVAVKRHMGDREYRVEVGGQTLNPVEVSCMILQKLVAAASEQLGEKVENVVISVPAYFNNNQKEDTRLAGEKAGLKVLRLIPEPTAAAIAYGLNKNRDQTILVYDLGGGTFDVSILKVRRNDFEVVGIGGAHDLGGEDFDGRLIDLIQQQLRLDPRALGQGSDADSARRQEQLKEAAEKAKIELSATEEVEVEIPGVIPDELFRMKITRAQFEAAIGDLVERTVKITLQTLKDSGLAPDDVDRVVLVGGSTRVCMIQKILAEKVCDPYIADNVDEVVAQGAAIMAANLSGVEESLAPIEVTNVSAHSLGIRAEKDKFSVLIPRGTPLPAQQNKAFTTARDNADRTDVVVFQGDQEKCTDNEQIGGFGLTGIARAKAGAPRIDVTFTVDGDDILTVFAKDLSTGSGGQVRIEKFEPKPYDPEEEKRVTLDSLRIGVSPRGCDDAGAILRRLGLKYKDLTNAAFGYAQTAAQYDVLFINCLCDTSQMFGGGSNCNPRRNKKPLSDFVSRGGVLYVSDYACENVSKIFPKKISFAGKVGPVGTFPLQVVDPEMQKVVGKTTKGLFGPGYVVVSSVSADCTVHMTRGSEPVLVSFPHGDGHVIYTSFHNDVKAGPAVIKVVSYVVLQAVSLATSTPLVELVETAKLK